MDFYRIYYLSSNPVFNASFALSRQDAGTYIKTGILGRQLTILKYPVTPEYFFITGILRDLHNDSMMILSLSVISTRSFHSSWGFSSWYCLSLLSIISNSSWLTIFYHWCLIKTLERYMANYLFFSWWGQYTFLISQYLNLLQCVSLRVYSIVHYYQQNGYHNFSKGYKCIKLKENTNGGIWL